MLNRMFPLTFAAISLALPAAAQPAPSPQGSPTERPTPVVDFGSHSLEFDLPGLEIGIAEYEEGPTGTTIFYFPEGAQVVADVRGGFVATLNTDLLVPGNGDGNIEAIVLSGGSAYGLEAATGVAGAMLRTGRTNTRSDGDIAEVAGAIVYDFGARYTEVYPDVRLGEVAFRNARPGVFPLGSRGAGRSVWQGGFFQEWIPSGQGAAFRQIGATKIAVFTVVNAWGAIVDRDGNVARCRHRDMDRVADHFASLEETAYQDQVAGRLRPVATEGLTSNTTLTVVVVNRQLEYGSLRRLAIEVQASMARAIQPFNTGEDGDVVFVATTAAVDDPEMPLGRLAIHAGEVAWDAVLASIPIDLPALPTATRTRVAVPQPALERLAGVYEFRSGVEVSLEASADGLLLGRLEAGIDRLELFPEEGQIEVLPQSETVFFLDNFWDDTLEFRLSPEGDVLGFVLNPGPRGLPARRIR